MCKLKKERNNFSRYFKYKSKYFFEAFKCKNWNKNFLFLHAAIFITNLTYMTSLNLITEKL